MLVCRQLVGPVRPPSERAQRISAPVGSWAIVLSPRSSLAMTAYGATLSPEQVRRRSGIHLRRSLVCAASKVGCWAYRNAGGLSRIWLRPWDSQDRTSVLN